MKALHRAAARRAYRTFWQTATSSTAATAILALVTDGQTALPALYVAAGTTLVATFVAFGQGIVQGLPEAPKP